MAADQLSLYNGALVTHLGADPVSSIDPAVEDTPESYALHQIWGRRFIERCLRKGQWNFACRSQKLEYEPSITPSFGYRRAFTKPDDFVRIMGLCSDEYYRYPIREYDFQGGYWWCDLDQIYVRYVSNDSQYGLDYSLWPEDFESFVECDLALQVATRIVGWRDRVDALKTDSEELLTLAKAADAQEQPAKQNPPGSWSSARHGPGQGEHGNSSRLIG